MEHAALFVLGPLGLPFLIYGIINYAIYFRLGGSNGVLDPSVVKLGFFKANFTLNFPIGWSWSLRFDPS